VRHLWIVAQEVVAAPGNSAIQPVVFGIAATIRIRTTRDGSESSVPAAPRRFAIGGELMAELGSTLARAMSNRRQGLGQSALKKKKKKKKLLKKFSVWLDDVACRASLVGAD